MEEFFKNQLVLGALISIFSSTIILVVQTFITYMLSHQGKVNIYIKSVYNKITKKGWGFHCSANGYTYFNIPLWIEFHNTKNINQIIRNVNISLYNKGKFISKMVQITHHSENGVNQPLGNNGSYSFLLGPNEIRRYDLDFHINQKQLMAKNFDEARLSYYDTKDKYREYTIYQVKNSWSLKENEIDKDWRKVK